MAMKAEHILTDLFKAYQAQPSMLPGRYQDRIKDQEKERTICDYLAGMTDRFAVEEHQRLFDPTILP